MPTVARDGEQRVFFYSSGGGEPYIHREQNVSPPRFHIEQDEFPARPGLTPIRVPSSGVFGRQELVWLQQLMEGRLCEAGMTAPVIEVPNATAQRVEVADETLRIELTDGRTVWVPVAWYPRLLQGSPEEHSHWRLIGLGEGIHWPYLDEDISVAHVLLGIPSQESQTSLDKWLAGRAS